MNPLIRLIVVLALAGGGIYYGLSTYSHLKHEDEHKLDLVRIEKEYLERSNWVNSVADAEKYREERAGLNKWYFSALTEHYNRWPQFKNFYRYGDELTGKAPAANGKKAKKAEDTAAKKEAFELVKNAFDAMKDGSYSPVYTGASSSLHLDIYKAAKTQGHKGFRFDLVLWGAQRQMDKQAQASGGTISRMLTAAQFSGINFKFYDEKGKVVAEMPVTGDPEIKADYPERMIEEFPPQAVVGYYEMPPLPANAVKMDMVMNVTSRSSTGSDIPGNFKWTIPVESDWKLAPGETWDGATTEERSKDYIEGKAENP